MIVNLESVSYTITGTEVYSVFKILAYEFRVNKPGNLGFLVNLSVEDRQVQHSEALER